MAKPIAVVAGDIHYSLNNLELADATTRMAIAKANDLNVPFIANGDTHDQKANLRGECVNAMIATFKTAKIKPYVNIGNHCRINEKSIEHSLNFLEPYAHIIADYAWFDELQSYIISYQHSVERLRNILEKLPNESRIILHQGLNGSNMGEYAQDKSALDPNDLANFRTILSHYHARQDIKCGRPRKGGVGLASYIGSPYTTSFAEANDPPKGFQILMNDGTLEFVPTNLRKHLVCKIDLDSNGQKLFCPKWTETDLILVKVTGTKEQLSKINKNTVREQMGFIQDFRLDLIPTQTETNLKIDTQNLPQDAILDSLIDANLDASAEQKARLKAMWKELK